MLRNRPQASKGVRKKGFDCTEKLKPSDKFDFIYTSNVLEHIEDDLETLRNLNNHLTPGGSMVIFVPAFQRLYSQLDLKVGHFRRYEKREIIEKLTYSNFEIAHVEYFDSVGFVATYALKFLGWKKIGNIGGSSTLKFYDRVLFPISLALDKVFSRVLGKNLFVIVRKKAQ